ncbi:deoxyribose-phosphate aldolase [Aquimarina algicola]|uniref:Deoxyribose-phosphate aldolase n=1 Tax=Aquimarina algicola TaxID=2589995 RepID=A0A504J1H9_9FLAO|nr:deoxyribose-phosphate aldolase [Aquimarina algicola]
MKEYRYIIIILIVFLFSGNIEAQLSAQQIIDKTIHMAGGAKYDNAYLDFTFRGKQYSSIRKKGLYQLERYVNTTNGLIHDVVTNSGLQRTLNNCPTKVADSLVTRISDGVNSVHYFANLPYGLNAPAVKKELIGESVIKGNSYYKIKVTFDEVGGGTDFEDEFLYWIHKDNFTVDYLAYKYAVNGGGVRFREAYNVRTINGIRFVDYYNYKTDVLKTPLSDLDSLFEKGKLKLLSKIELKDIRVYFERDCC